MKKSLLSIIVFTVILYFNSWVAQIKNNDFDTLITMKNCEIKIHTSKSNGGKMSSESKFVSINFKPTPEMISEAKTKMIHTDKIYFELIYEENCVLRSVMIRKNGKLDSFNSAAEQFRLELYKLIKDSKISKYFENNDYGKCENVILPVTFLLE